MQVHPNQSVMGCHGNHAFTQSPNWFIYGDICIQGVPGDNLAPIQNCPWGARWVKLDPGVVDLKAKSVYDVCLCFQLIYQGFINIFE